MNILAIDPGVNGGIALVIDGITTVHKMPDSIYDIQDFFMDDPTYDSNICVIEQIHKGSAAQGPRKGVKQIWSQAQNYTALMCALYNANIKTIEVSPAKWMSKLPGTRPKEYKDRKKWLKEHAQRLFPEIKVTLWNADALCLMHVSKEFI